MEPIVCVRITIFWDTYISGFVATDITFHTDTYLIYVLISTYVHFQAGYNLRIFTNMQVLGNSQENI